MNNKGLEQRLSNEIEEFIHARKTLNLASIDKKGHPYASYAPFSLGDNCLYVLLSDIAIHGENLKLNPKAAILIVEDETECSTIFARIRVNYQVIAEHIKYGTEAFQQGIDCLHDKHGDQIINLSKLSDFHLFKLMPINGRYVKGFGKAYTLSANSLFGNTIDQLRDGHKTRTAAMS